MALRFLAVHLQMHHGRATGGRRYWESKAPDKEPRTYIMAFPTTGGPRNCPDEGCPGRAAMWKAMQVDYFH